MPPRDRTSSVPSSHRSAPLRERGTGRGLAAIPPTEISRLRRETRGCAHRIHLNNAGAALPPAPVLEAVITHLELEAEMGGYEAADARAEAISEAYEDVARLVGTSPRNIAVVESATVAVSQALSSIPFRPGDRIVTTRNDYVSNQIMLLSLEARMGVEVIRAPDAPEGGVDVAALEGIIHRRAPRLVALTHVPTSSGLVQPAEEVGRLCRARGVLYLVDACQSVGQMPIDVTAMGCDFLAATSRKFLRGPRGTGFLYVSDRALEEPLEPLFPDLRGADWVDDDLYQPAPDARRFETWESSVAATLGMGAAARYAADVGLDAIYDRTRALAELLRGRLAELPGVRVLDAGRERVGIVTLSANGHDPAELVGRLREARVNASATDLGSALLDFREKGVAGALRLSPHYYNTEEELEEAVEALSVILAGPSRSPHVD